MLPYRTRVPIYGGKLKKKKKAEAEKASASDPPALSGKGRKKLNSLAPLSGGGPVERAIKADLVALRRSFRRIVAGAVGNCEYESTLLGHDVSGLSFKQFKDAFRRGNFGIIQTRCVPPRCDKADYEQMIFSACFSLMEETLAQDCGTTGNGCLGEEGSFAADAACSVFSLYTFYETNPLPPFPIAPVDNGGFDVRSTLDRFLLSTTDQDALSTLTMGITSEDPSKGLHRRSYREGIRISRKHYAALQMVRDLSLEAVAKCESNRTKYWKKDVNCRIATIANKTSTESLRIDIQSTENKKDEALTMWKCTCGVARDCIQIVDRMFAKKIFDCCEYTGPCSVEGLAGSTEYYEKVLSKPTGVAMGMSALVASSFTGNAVNSLEKRGETLLSEMDVSELDLLYKEYGKSLDSTEAHMAARYASEARAVFDAQKPQHLTQIKDALDPVLACRDSREDLSVTNMLRQCCIAFGEIQTDSKGLITGTGDRSSQVNHSSVEDQQHREKQKKISNTPMAGDASPAIESVLIAVNEVEGPTDDRPAFRIRHPPDTSDSLKKGIDRALEGLFAKTTTNAFLPTMRHNAPKETSYVAQEKSLGFSFVYDDECLGVRKEELSSTRLEGNDDQYSSESGSDGSSSLLSVASTLMGQNALNKLLSKANERCREGVVAKNNEIWTDVDSMEMSRVAESNQAVKSRDGVEQAQAALGYVLAKARARTKAKPSKKIPASMEKVLSESATKHPPNNYCDQIPGDTDTVTIVDGAGQTALESLLNKARGKPNQKAKKRKVFDEPKKTQLPVKRQCIDYVEEVDSLATGNDAGHAALGALLTHVQIEKQGAAKASHQSRKTESPMERRCIEDTEEVNSLATGNGAGHAALGALLAQVQIVKQGAAKASDQANKMKLPAKRRSIGDAEEVDSLATGNGAGHAALGALLAHVQNK